MNMTNLFDLLSDDELNRVGDELGVFLDDILHTLLLKVLRLVFLEVQADLSATTEWWVHSVGGDGEGTTCGRLPDVLLVVIVLRDDLNALRNEVSGIETDTELANHGNISARAECLHEALKRNVNKKYQTRAVDKCYLRPRLGNGTEVVDHIGLGHADATVADGEDLIFLVRNYANEKFPLRIEHGGISEGSIANFVESVGAIGDDFTKEDFLVGVERVCSRVEQVRRRVNHREDKTRLTYDQVEQLRNLGLEAKAFWFGCGHFRINFVVFARWLHKGEAEGPAEESERVELFYLTEFLFSKFRRPSCSYYSHA